MIALVGCTSEPATVTADEFLVELQAICAETADGLDALPEPPEQISVTDFATEAATLLAGEADQIRRLDAPSELDDDQRAFVRNTDEQAAAWRTVADDQEELADVTTQIAELIFGRNDLADEMGATGCRRGDG